MKQVAGLTCELLQELCRLLAAAPLLGASRRRRNFHERAKFKMSFATSCEPATSLAGAASGRAGSRRRTSPDALTAILIPVLAVSALAILSSCAPKAAPPAEATSNVVGSIVRLEPAFDALVPKSAQIEKLAGGFQFTEGPLWFPSGHLWFSDVVGNVVRQSCPMGRSWKFCGRAVRQERRAAGLLHRAQWHDRG